MWTTQVFRSLSRASVGLNRMGIGRLSVFRPLKLSAKRILLRALTEDGTFKIDVDGSRLYIFPETWDFHAYVDRPFEPYTVELFKCAIKPGSRVLDIGAQFGYYSLLAAKRTGCDGKVYAFEPAPVNFKLLERNIQANGYGNIIHAVQKGVGERHTTASLFLYEGSDSHGMYRHPNASVKGTVLFECVTIDDFIHGERVDVIKMDIEGNEPYALKGMERTVSENDRLIMFAELAPANLRGAGVEPESYLAQLENLGFDIKLIDENTSSLKPVTRDLLREAGQDSCWYANLYCVKAAKDSGTRYESRSGLPH